MVDELTFTSDEDADSLENAQAARRSAMPVEVEILTKDYEIRGIVFVSRKTRKDRRISELLNDPERRFLAIIDADVASRMEHAAPRHYAFVQINIDNILMMHPSTQSVVNHSAYSKDEALRFDQFRQKMNRVL